MQGVHTNLKIRIKQVVKNWLSRNRDILYVGIFLAILVAISASLYFTTRINNSSVSLQSRAAGRCGTNCDNPSAWISDCLRHNGQDKSAQCNSWFAAECSNCDSGGGGNNTPAPTAVPGNNTSDGGSIYDPASSANDADIQNRCGANPNDPRCCRINEWKNRNQGAQLPECGGGSTGGNNGGSNTPTPNTSGVSGSCNNGQIPNGSWACFSTTKVVQCVNGQYKNESTCASCRGVSTNKSSICTGGLAETLCDQGNPAYVKCPANNNQCMTRDDCSNLAGTIIPTPTPKRTSNYNTGTPTPTFIPNCNSPEIWCSTLNECKGRTNCPTPVPDCPSGTIRCSWSNTCMSRVECDDPNNQITTPTKTPCEQGNGAYTICPAANNKCMLREDCNDLSGIQYKPPVIQTSQKIVIEACNLDAYINQECHTFVLSPEEASVGCRSGFHPLTQYPAEVTQKLVEQMCPIYQQQQKSGR